MDGHRRQPEFGPGFVVGCGVVSVQKQEASRHEGQVTKEGDRLVEVVQKAAAENGIEAPVTSDVPRVVMDEAQIRKIQALRYQLALVDVRTPAFDADDVVAAASKFHGIAAL
jgi:hypothetical protein